MLPQWVCEKIEHHESSWSVTCSPPKWQPETNEHDWHPHPEEYPDKDKAVPHKVTQVLHLSYWVMTSLAFCVMEVWGVFFFGGGRLEVKQITKMLRFWAMKIMENQKRPTTMRIRSSEQYIQPTNTNNNVIVVISNNPHKNREVNNIKQPCY